MIRKGMATFVFVEVGSALKDIRDGRLYREAYETFEAYCRTEWDIDRTYAHYLIESSAVVEAITVHHGEHVPQNERHARPLTDLDDPEDPEDQAEAWERAVETAPKDAEGPAEDNRQARPGGGE